MFLALSEPYHKQTLSTVCNDVSCVFTTPLVSLHINHSMNNLNSHCPIEDSNSRSPEYGDRLITARPRCSVREVKKDSRKETRR